MCVCVKNLLKMWLLEFQCGFLKMPPGSHSGFLKLTSSAHRDMHISLHVGGLLMIVKMGRGCFGGSVHPLKNYGGFV